MLLLNEVIELSFTSKGSVCLFIARVGRACLENSTNMRSRLRLQTPGDKKRRGPSVSAHTPHQPDTTREHAHSIPGMTLTRANCLAGGRQETDIVISDWLESRALLVQSKTSGCRKSSLSPFPHVPLEIITFIAWIWGPALWLFSKYVEVMEE